MISIRWSSRAADEFEALINHISEDNPEAALSMAQNVLDRIAQIQTFPNIGRPGERPGTRELVVAPFVVVYCRLLASDRRRRRNPARLARRTKLATSNQNNLILKSTPRK